MRKILAAALLLMVLASPAFAKHYHYPYHGPVRHPARLHHHRQHHHPHPHHHHA